MQRSGTLEFELSGDRALGSVHGETTQRTDSAHLQHLTDLLVESIYRATAERKLTTITDSQTLTDEITGLLTRRGFFCLAEHQLRQNERMPRPVFLAIVALNGLRKIRDSLGHHEGDLALQEVARILRSTCRESDILARVGEDEFAVLGIGDPERTDEILLARLLGALNQRNAKQNRYDLSVIFGMAHWDSRNTWSIETLIAKARESMREKKQ